MSTIAERQKLFSELRTKMEFWKTRSDNELFEVLKSVCPVLNPVVAKSQMTREDCLRYLVLDQAVKMVK